MEASPFTLITEPICQCHPLFKLPSHIHTPSKERHVKSIVCSSNCVVRADLNGELYLNPALYHSSDLSEASCERCPPLEWYKQAFPKLTKLTQILKNVDLIDGMLVDVNDDSTVNDERLNHRMHKFKALSGIFLGAPPVLKEVNKNIEAVMAGKKSSQYVCFSKQNEREPMIVDSLTTICNILGISAQQRKVVRFTICAQVTQHQMWTGALEQLLKNLEIEIRSLKHLVHNKNMKMSEQIVSTCLKFLAETANSHDEDTSSWMRPKPKVFVDSSSTHKWGEVLDMFNDLVGYLKDEDKLVFYVSKLESMKEGLAQIKDVLIDRNIGYREVRHQENLVQKKLSKTLGHSSRCLFTLLRYYLHDTIRNVEVEVCGGLYELGGPDQICLYMGKVLTSNEEVVIWRGVKQLDRALGLFKFVWESAKMKGTLELQGHLWCVGAQHKTLTYRKNLFFIHGISVIHYKGKMASTSLIFQLSPSHRSPVCRSCMKHSPNVIRCHTKHLSRRLAILTVTFSTVLTREAVLDEHKSALGFDLRMTAPDQTVEEAESVIRDHARALLEMKSVIESEDWREIQQELRKKSSLLKQDIYTFIQSKPGNMRPLLRKLYFNLFNNVTKSYINRLSKKMLDYAARDKDLASVKECFENISTALNDILSRILA
ncbi:hypothetical protein V2J09_001175 [Rumex salicifolius]